MTSESTPETAKNQSTLSAEAAPNSTQVLAICLFYQALLLISVFVSAYFLAASPDFFLEYASRIFQNWDAGLYLRLAEFGYSAEESQAPLIVFFPLYPLSIRGLAWFLGYLEAALAISVIASVAGHYLFYRYLIELGYAHRKALRILFLLFCAPISLYFCTAYSEALYFLISVVFLIQLHRGNFLLAALMGAFAAFTRNMGFLFLIPYIAAAISKINRGNFLVRICGIPIIAAGSATYLGLNYFIYGNAFAFQQFLKDNWYKSSENPFIRYYEALIHFAHESKSIQAGYELIYIDRVLTLVLPLLFILYFLRTRKVTNLQTPNVSILATPRLPAGFFVWTLAQYAVICSQSFWVSNTRYLGMILPIYLILESLLRSSIAYWLFVFSSGLIALLAFYNFVHLSWVF